MPARCPTSADEAGHSRSRRARVPRRWRHARRMQLQRAPGHRGRQLGRRRVGVHLDVEPPGVALQRRDLRGWWRVSRGWSDSKSPPLPFAAVQRRSSRAAPPSGLKQQYDLPGAAAGACGCARRRLAGAETLTLSCRKLTSTPRGYASAAAGSPTDARVMRAGGSPAAQRAAAMLENRSQWVREMTIAVVCLARGPTAKPPPYSVLIVNMTQIGATVWTADDWNSRYEATACYPLLRCTRQQNTQTVPAFGRSYTR